jgi:hypothetical protein
MAVSYDLSGLVLLEQTVQQMQLDQQSSPTRFTGAAPITASYSKIPGMAGTSETTTTLDTRIRALHLNLNLLNR